MACKVVELTAPNGQTSILFQDLMQEVKDQGLALYIYLDSKNNTYKELDINGEPVVREVLPLGYKLPDTTKVWDQRAFTKEDTEFYNAQPSNKTQAETVQKLISGALNITGTEDNYIWESGGKKTIMDRVSGWLDKSFPKDKFDGNYGDYTYNAELGNQADDLLSRVVVTKDLDKIGVDSIKEFMQESIAERNATREDQYNLLYNDEVLGKLVDIFKKFVKTHKDKGEVIMTQVPLYNREKEVAGTADIITINEDGIATIYDLKTSIKSFIDEYTTAEGMVNHYKQSYWMVEKVENLEAQLKSVNDLLNDENITEDEVVTLNAEKKQLEQRLKDANRGKKVEKISRATRHARQLSAYKALAKAQGIEVKNIRVFPIHITEENGEVSDVTHAIFFRDADKKDGIAANTVGDVYNKLVTDRESQYYDQASKAPDYQKLIDKINILLKQRLDRINDPEFTISKKLKNTVEGSIKRMQKIMGEVVDAEKLTNFIHNTSIQFYRGENADKTVANVDNNRLGYFWGFKTLVNELDSLGEDITQKEAEKYIPYLNRYRELAYTHKEIIEDLREFFRNSTDGNDAVEILEGTPLEVLNKLELDINGMLKDYHTRVKPSLAKLLETQISKKAVEGMSEIKKTKVKRLTAQLKKVQEAITKIEARDSISLITRPRYASLKAKRSLINKELNRLDSLKERNYESILAELDMVDTVDEGILDYLTTPVISSSNPILALYAKLTKSRFDKVHIDSMKFAGEMYKAYKEFVKASGRSVNNTEELNKGIYEEVSMVDYKDGKFTVRKELQFVREFDVSKYSEEYVKMQNEVALLRETSITQANEKRRAWFKENLTVDNVEEILKEHKDNMLSEDYAEWLLENLTGDTSKVRSGEISVKDYVKSLEETVKKNPESVINYNMGIKNDFLIHNEAKFPNKRWEDLQKNVAAAKYHKILTTKYLEMQEKLPEHQRSGYVLPSIVKSGKEAFWSKKKLEYYKYSAGEVFKKKKEDEDEYGVTTEDHRKVIPVLYTWKMDPNLKSVDLFSSIMRFNEGTERYQAALDLKDKGDALVAVFKEGKPIETKGGKKLITKTAEKLGLLKEYKRRHTDSGGGVSYLAAHLEAFIDSTIYGKYKIETKLGNTSIDKIVDNLMKVASFTQIGGDVMKGVSNSLMAQAMTGIEAASGEFFNSKELASAKLEYLKNSRYFISEFNKPVKKHLINQLIQLYDPMQGEYLDQYGRNVSGNAAKKLIDSNTWFFAMHAGEHEANVTTMIAHLRKVKVKQDGKEISLYDAYLPGEDGVPKLKKGVDLGDNVEGEILKVDARNTVHAISKRSHGVYNEFDKPIAERYVVGRLLSVYRKFIAPGVKRRFKKLGTDEELSATTEGVYKTFFETLILEWQDMIKTGFGFEKSDKYTDGELANLRRTSMEMAVTFVTMGVVSILSTWDPDDEDERLVRDYLTYQATRLSSELQFFMPVPRLGLNDVLRILQSPSASYGIIKKTMRFVDTLFLVGEDRYYKRDAGIAEKGDAKWWIAILKLLGRTGTNTHPEEAVKMLKIWN